MTVLKGEGKVPILFGSVSVPVGTITRGGYLARPDLAGEWPTVLYIPSAWGVTSAAKDLCRKLARRGLAVIVPDLYRSQGPARDAPLDQAEVALASVSTSRIRGDVAAMIEFIANPAGFWSSAEAGFGMLGVGAGGSIVADAAAEVGPACVSVVSAPLGQPQHGAEHRQLGWLVEMMVPFLGLYGRDDEIVPVGDISAARSAAPHSEWAIYDGVGHDFMDDYLPDFDLPAYTDAVERLAAFFEKHLPEAPVAE